MFYHLIEEEDTTRTLNEANIQNLADIQSAAHNLYLASWLPIYDECQRVQWAIIKNGLYFKEINSTTDPVILNIGEDALTLEMCANIRILYVDHDISKWDLWAACIQKAAQNGLESLTIKLPSFTVTGGDGDADLNEDSNLTSYHLLISRLVALRLTYLELINSDRELVFGKNFRNLLDVVYTDCIYSSKWIDLKEPRITMNNWEKNDVSAFVETAKERKVHSQLLKNLPADNPKPIKDLSEIDEVLMETRDGKQFRYFDRESASLASNDLVWIGEVLVELFNENQPDDKKVKTINEMGKKGDEKDQSADYINENANDERKLKVDKRKNTVYIDQLFIDASDTPSDKIKSVVIRILRAIKSLRFLRITTKNKDYYNDQIQIKRSQMDVEITLKSDNGQIEAQTYVSYPKKYLLTNKPSLVNAHFVPGPWTHVALQIEDASLLINTVDKLSITGDLEICANLKFIAIQSQSWGILSEVMTAMESSFRPNPSDLSRAEGVMVYNENISVSMTRKRRVEVVLHTTKDLDKSLELIPQNGRDYCFDIRWGIIEDKFVESGYAKFAGDVLKLMSVVKNLANAQNLEIAGNVSLFFECLAKNFDSLKVSFAGLTIEYLRIITPVMCDELSAANIFPNLDTVLLNASPQAIIYFAMVDKFRLDLMKKTNDDWYHIGELSTGIGSFSAISKQQKELVMEYCEPQPKIWAHTLENEFSRQRHTFAGSFAQTND